MPTGGGPRAAVEILFVCTGNICRSPMAERLVAVWLSRSLGPATGRVRVASAGTYAQEGWPIEPHAARMIEARGGNATNFAARQLTVSQLVSADLVLTATREHRAAAVRLDPRVLEQCFTFREFGRLAADIDPVDLGTGAAQRLRALVDAAAMMRGRRPPPKDPTDDDVPDPYGRPAVEYEVCADLITTALTQPIAHLVR